MTKRRRIPWSNKPFSLLYTWQVVVGLAGVLSGCVSDTVNLQATGNASRFAIESYTASNDNSDITGLWVTLHEGKLNNTVDNIQYEVTGHIREIVEITEDQGSYYLRSCLEPEHLRPLTINGDQISVQMNSDTVQLINNGNVAMNGTASHSASDSNYSGTVAMKKVAALQSSLGSFVYMDESQSASTQQISCFQEAWLRVIGRQGIFSQWSDVETFTASDWSAGNGFVQMGYLMSRAGTANPAKQMAFKSAVGSNDPVIRNFPQNNENITATTSESKTNSYKSAYSLGNLLSGNIDMSASLGVDALVEGQALANAPEENSNSAPPWWQWFTNLHNDFMSFIQNPLGV